MHICAFIRGQPQLSFSCCQRILFETGSLFALTFAKWAGLAGQWTPGFCLYFINRDYMHGSPYLLFSKVISRGGTQVLVFAKQPIYVSKAKTHFWVKWDLEKVKCINLKYEIPQNWIKHALVTTILRQNISGSQKMTTSLYKELCLLLQALLLFF